MDISDVRYNGELKRYFKLGIEIRLLVEFKLIYIKPIDVQLILK